MKKIISLVFLLTFVFAMIPSSAYAKEKKVKIGESREDDGEYCPSNGNTCSYFGN